MKQDADGNNTGLKPYRRPVLLEQLEGVVNTYFANLMELPKTEWPVSRQIGREILSDMQQHIHRINSSAGKGGMRERMVQSIPPVLAADILMRLYRFAMINLVGGDSDGQESILAMYVEDGPDAGIYSINDTRIDQVIHEVDENAGKSELWTIRKFLSERAERLSPCRDPKYIAVENGIFDDETKQLLPFTPDLVFLTKIRVPYDPGAMDTPILEPDGSYWTVESWFQSINTHAENVRFLWDTLAMSVRPNRCFGKVVFLYSNKGNNGKGTYCQLMKNLLGDGNYAGINIAAFGKPFMLTRLPYVQAIIADENPVGGFVDDVSEFKAIATQDTLQVDRKYKDPVTMKFYGIVVQCINGFPKFRDQSGSLLRRFAMVEMDQCFTGKEKKYIKSDFLGRMPVLQYVLRKLLEMTVDENTMTTPSGSDGLLQEYREFNDPVFEFWNEFKDVFVWNLLPFTFLYDLFKKWFDRFHPRGKLMAYKSFVQNIRAAAETTGGWNVNGMSPIRSNGKMDELEHLILDWDLTEWMNRTYTGNDVSLKLAMERKQMYRGLVRL